MYYKARGSCAFSRLKKKKASVKGIYLPDPAVMRRQEINIADVIFPESLSRKSWDKEQMLSASPRPTQA